MIIPNSVGRIDAITDAIRNGDREQAIQLTGCEHVRLLRKWNALKIEMDKIRRDCEETTAFKAAIEDIDDAWHMARVECGHKPETVNPESVV